MNKDTDMLKYESIIKPLNFIGSYLRDYVKSN